MARSSAWLSLSLSFLVLFNGCFGRRQSFHGQESQNEKCQLSQIHAIRPTGNIPAEGGTTEFWDPNHEQFQCGGAYAFRHIIQPNGLFLPSYTSAPLVAYVLQGSGEYGIIVPGCAETYQQSEKGSEILDKYQKIRYYEKGDIIVIPASAVHWFYNQNREPTILVVLQRANPVSFFLAGKPGSSHQGQREQGRQQQELMTERLGYDGNILAGFDVQIVKDALNTDRETAEKIIGGNARGRGHIVIVQQLPSRPEQRRQPGRQGGGSSNALEETLCTATFTQNIDNRERADIYDSRAGRLTTLNSFTLPALSFVRLSAARGFLNKNWGLVPQWSMNAHSFLYVTKGSALIQIVNQRGDTILNEQVQEGQLFLVPQNFAVVKQAGDEGFEWVEFSTNENAMYNTFSGRRSTLAGMPADIIAASYDLSKSQAQNLKDNMSSLWFYQASGSSPSSSSSSGRSAFI
ncbi:PREDICTED: 13S globulin seed storage protein 1-like [Ipomoea nil]|uniref:13S globulin seed storage protein 1-like n=1 Tax=Ipomoea nil TaxID=35883 RepID=UPI00090096BE|nr:PREDICTED: 13S globulin seed storage protein 1-like [Ipomoea nil]